jgi:hypothetical protein
LLAIAIQTIMTDTQGKVAAPQTSRLLRFRPPRQQDGYLKPGKIARVYRDNSLPPLSGFHA